MRPVPTGQETTEGLKDAVVKRDAVLAALDQEKLGPKQALQGAHAFQPEPGVTLLDEGDHEAGDFVNKIVHVGDDTLQTTELTDENVAFGRLINTRRDMDKAGQTDVEESRLDAFVVQARIVPGEPTTVAVGKQNVEEGDVSGWEVWVCLGRDVKLRGVNAV